jgi:arabinose-5-phosphate isomerase
MSHADVARDVLRIERNALDRLAGALSSSFDEAVDLVLAASGRLVTTGMGKSGLIAHKISATLASTGTRSFFMHPAEAWHGDLGMLAAGDVVLALSYSGETEELVRLIPFLEDQAIPLIAMTGNPASTLARHASVHLDAAVDEEACPLRLAPTASTTAALALGDAFAMALMSSRGFRSEEFAQLHPGGSLGRRLLQRARDVMKSHDLPLVSASATVRELLHVVSSGRLGICVVLDDEQILGVVTDGDLRRTLERHGADALGMCAGDIMTRNPSTITPDTRVQSAVQMMEERSITVLLVVEDARLKGLLHLFDCHL